MIDQLFIPPQHTKISQEELLKALNISYNEMFKEQISFFSLGILWSQIALETGRLNFCYNWNLGNIRRTKNHTYTMYKCSEIIAGKEIFYSPPDPKSQFNAYFSLSQACSEHLAFLHKERYLKALEAMREGRYNDYVPALKKGDYFTASLERYQNTFLKLFQEYQNKYGDWYHQNYEVSIYLNNLPYTA